MRRSRLFGFAYGRDAPPPPPSAQTCVYNSSAPIYCWRPIFRVLRVPERIVWSVTGKLPWICRKQKISLMGLSETYRNTHTLLSDCRRNGVCVEDFMLNRTCSRFSATGFLVVFLVWTGHSAEVWTTGPSIAAACRQSQPDELRVTAAVRYYVRSHWAAIISLLLRLQRTWCERRCCCCFGSGDSTSYWKGEVRTNRP